MVKETLFIFLALYVSTIYAELQLQQAVVISRHGSRRLLRKDHKTFKEGSDSQLTVRGMDQMFRAGSYVREHYHNLSFLSRVYSPQDIYVRSSDYSRTLNSALSFLLGLYPPRNQTRNTSHVVFHAPYNIQQVPIHTVAVENDQLLRGWLACPELQKRLAKFYKSKEFQKKKAESADLRKTLEKIYGFKKIEFKDFYNVYDYIHLHRLYNHTHLTVNNKQKNLRHKPVITEKQWKQVVYYADWLEYNKYGKKMIGDIGGGLLANEIALNFNKVAKKQSKTKLFYYSAHYPTMFSLFTALGLNKDPTSPLRRIPYYASLVFIELWRDSDDGKFFVQFSFRNGLEEPLKPYSIPGCPDPCTLEQFTNFVTSLKVRDISSWCHACNNSKLSRCPSPSYNVQLRVVKESKMSPTGAFFLGAFIALLLAIFATASWHFCLRKRCFPGGVARRPVVGLSELEHGPGVI